MEFCTVCNQLLDSAPEELYNPLTDEYEPVCEGCFEAVGNAREEFPQLIANVVVFNGIPLEIEAGF